MKQKLVLFFAIFSVFIFLFFQNAVLTPLVADESSVEWTILKRELKGFASQTTGGIGGPLAFVTTTADYDVDEPAIPGSLRALIESSDKSKPLWIKFKILNSANPTIFLKRSLKLRPNLTIDGRGSKVIISNKINWALYEPLLVEGYRAQCKKVDPKTPATHLLLLENTKNVILTHFKLTREGFNSSPWDAGGSSSVKYPGMDKECLGDMISIFDRRPEGLETPSPAVSNNIWINHLTIENCGDGCIDFVRPDFVAHNLTISNNKFENTDKTMILGTPYSPVAPPAPDGKSLVWDIPYGRYYLRASLYNNWFHQSKARNPKVASALIHVFNNYYDSIGSYAVLAIQSKVFFEENIFSNLNRDAIEHYTYTGADGRTHLQSYDGHIYPYNNFVNSGSKTIENLDGYVEYRTRWMPSVPILSGASLTPAMFLNAGAGF